MERDKFIALLSKKLSADISEKELVLLNEAITNNNHYALLANELGTYLNKVEYSNASAEQLEGIWEKIGTANNSDTADKFKYTQPKLSLLANPLFRIAAIFVMALTVGFLSYRFFSGGDDINQLTAADQKVFKVLADGTNVWLNKKSTISYNDDFGKKKREIFLEGEAYFDVVKNADVPLIIHAGGIDIEVKGTAFNVNAYPKNNAVQVALVRGAIAVTDRQNSKNSVLLKPNDKLFFSAKLTQSENAFQIVKLNPTFLLKDASWVADTLTFNKEKLHDLALKLEKKYDVKVEIQSEKLKEKRFTGSFTNETLDQALQALKLSYPFTYTVNQRVVVIKD